ncbi:acyl carrier protein [Mycolicibacterium canariasense]|uniref:acyl carrier protein n=1 Tax=Mycolicibacterium canariasense TaxID=228230 RepID=UPI0010425650|nr:acyl carrier protein [Mycolicibacterium canariasense]
MVTEEVKDLAVTPSLVDHGANDDHTVERQIDLDWLKVLGGVHPRFGFDIPEFDHDRLQSLADILGYVFSRTELRPRSSPA